MKTVEQVWRSGDSCVITIRTLVLEAMKLKEGDVVEVEITKVSK